jgi:hypothetical protein
VFCATNFAQKFIYTSPQKPPSAAEMVLRFKEAISQSTSWTRVKITSRIENQPLAYQEIGNPD